MHMETNGQLKCTKHNRREVQCHCRSQNRSRNKNAALDVIVFFGIRQFCCWNSNAIRLVSQSMHSRYLFNIVPRSFTMRMCVCVCVCAGLFKWHLSFRWETRENRYRNAIKKSYYRTNIILVCSIDSLPMHIQTQF